MVPLLWCSSHLSSQQNDLLGHSECFCVGSPSYCLFVPEMHVGHVVTMSAPFKPSCPVSVCLSVCTSVSNCGLIVKTQYITCHLVHSPRRLVMVTECPERTQKEKSECEAVQ